jgi:hypothetical protein
MKTTKMIKMKYFLLFGISIIIQSCLSYNNLQIEKYGQDSIYKFGNNSNDLLIYIEGSGKTSVLGIKKDDRWISVYFGYFVTRYFSNTYTVLIPEKLNIEFGEDHTIDPIFLKNYTVEKLVKSYCNSIDGYLEKHPEYENVYFLAGSEGGLLFPKIYTDLINKEKIRKAIITGAGGLDQYECFKILAQSKIPMPKEYKEECRNVEKEFIEITNDPESITKKYFGWPYSRWNSFFKYKPFDYYKNIQIPILFYQGKLDWNSPVESVEYIQKNISNKLFEYRYIESMGHTFETGEDQMKNLVNEFTTWLKK